MIAGKYNITCSQGSTLDILMILQYPNPDYPGNCEDPNICPEYLNWDLPQTIINEETGHKSPGYMARMHVRKYVESAVPMITLTTENDRIFLNEEPGSIRLHLRPEETRTIPTTGVYDLEIISTVSNEVDRVVQGSFIISEEVTR